MERNGPANVFDVCDECFEAMREECEEAIKEDRGGTGVYFLEQIRYSITRLHFYGPTLKMCAL